MLSPDYEKRKHLDRVKTVLIGLTIGCLLAGLLFYARYQSSQRAASGSAPPATSSPATPGAQTPQPTPAPR
ncbi:MAG: hypothetical protein MUE97_04800 [Phycisphaerales bacterium]|jgi:hypothetical protein|nr:hypothetical protein [Phycisphaerales bacterium]